jgi:hypothetical protein
MRVVSDEGVEKLLVTARTRTTYNDIKIREFKTIAGVVSFFLGLGFAHVDLPLVEGTSRSHKLAPPDKTLPAKAPSDKAPSDRAPSGKAPSDKAPSDGGAGS